MGNEGSPDTSDVFNHEPEARPRYAEIVAFFGHLAYRVPPLRETLAQHLVETQGEMLPHLLMDDVLEWLLDSVAEAPSDLMEATQILDTGYTLGSEALRHLFVVSLLEALPGFGGASNDPFGRGAAVRRALGPVLTEVLVELERYRRSGAQPLG